MVVIRGGPLGGTVQHLKVLVFGRIKHQEDDPRLPVGLQKSDWYGKRLIFCRKGFCRKGNFYLKVKTTMTATLYTESPTLKRRLRTYTANGYTFQMVQVEKGRFRMGDDDSKYNDEKPARWVDIAQDFELGQYPVTQGLWEAVMGENPSDFRGAERPVEQVSWNDIMGTKAGFLDRLNALPEIAELNAADGCRFGLPSEAQWEYAASGGRYGQTLGYAYAGSNYLPEVGWYGENSRRQTHPVGCKHPNALGLYDMSGNVREWCEDVWYKNYKDALVDGSARINGGTGGTGDLRVVRGGSWYDDGCGRVAFRVRVDALGRYDGVGFRLSRYWVTP